jgi:hypothetical protein
MTEAPCGDVEGSHPPGKDACLPADVTRFLAHDFCPPPRDGETPLSPSINTCSGAGHVSPLLRLLELQTPCPGSSLRTLSPAPPLASAPGPQLSSFSASDSEALLMGGVPGAAAAAPPPSSAPVQQVKPHLRTRAATSLCGAVADQLPRAVPLAGDAVQAAGVARPKRGRSRRVVEFDGVECSWDSSLPELTPEEAAANRFRRYQVRRRQRGRFGHRTTATARPAAPSAARSLLYNLRSPPSTPSPAAVDPVAPRGVGGTFAPPTAPCWQAEQGPATAVRASSTQAERLGTDSEPGDRSNEWAVKGRVAAAESRRDGENEMSELVQINADLRSTVDRLFHMNGRLYVEMGQLRTAAKLQGAASVEGSGVAASDLAAVARAQAACSVVASPTAPADAVGLNLIETEPEPPSTLPSAADGAGCGAPQAWRN